MIPHKFLLRLSLLVASWSVVLGLRAQPPANWSVNPSAYEFSMTLIFTVSVDGWIGGDADVAALFDSEGVCRGVETASFYNEQTGWYTGLMLVYANSSSLPNLTCAVYDVSTDEVLSSATTLNFQSNASLGSLTSPIVISAVGDPTVGCTDAAACNYLETAVTDNGSCVYPGCTDETACNFEASPACVDLSVCVFAAPGYDCDGNCLSDFDGDGICDGFEVGGCTNPAACNYDEAATDDDCSCTFAAFPYDCNGDCYLDADGDGICDVEEISGCTDPEACEYNPEATDDDSSCTYCCFQTGTTEVGGASGFGLAVEEFATAMIDGLTRTAWRIYVTTPDLNDKVLAVGGGAQGATFLSTTSSFYQHPSGSALASSVTPVGLAEAPDLVYDSWLTIGLAQAATAPNAINAVTSGASIWTTLFEFGEDVFLGNSLPGNWSVPSTAGNAIAGNDHRVLVAQLTTDGELSGSLTATVIPAGAAESLDLTLTFTPPVCGCMDSEACNYDSGALFDDGSCVFALEGRDCEDNCLADADGDDVCDADEIVGCTDPTAPNFNPDATDEGPCDVEGCTYSAADNYDETATIDDGSCSFTETGTGTGTGSDPPCADLNYDALIGTSDLLILLSQFGNGCQ